MKKIGQVIVALGPLLLTPLLGFLLAEGVLNLGGGEKDVIWVFFWGAWSMLFAIASMVLIWRSWPMSKWVIRAGLVATGGMLGLWLVALGVLLLR